MPSSDLFKFANDNNLSFSMDELLFVQNYFRNVIKMQPTFNQLFFLDKINQLRHAQKKGYNIRSVSTAEQVSTIIETSKDFLDKNNSLRLKHHGAMPISYASAVASRYLYSIDCQENLNFFTPAKGNASQYYIHTDNNIPLFSYSENSYAEQPRVNYHNVLTMLCPIQDMSYDDYVSRVNSFLSIPEISAMISDKSTIKAPFGMFEPLIKETNGILITFENIYEIPKNEYGITENLNLLFSSCIGRYIFATNNMSLGILNKVASEYSLAVCIFAVRNNSALFSFEYTKNPPFSVHFNFLQNIMRFTEDREYLLCDESNSPYGNKTNVYLSYGNGSTLQTYHAEKIFKFNTNLITATARSLDASPFKSAALAVIDAINALVAKGVSKNAISLSIHYSLLCGTDDAKELGKNFSAILGAYRSMIELCVSDSNPQISYNKATRNIVVLASSKVPKRTMQSNISSGNTNVYLYQLTYSEDGLPNYENYRKFIKYFYSLIENDNILSAFAINENFSTTFENASKNANIELNAIFNERFNKNSIDKLHGILFETKEFIDLTDDIINVGTTV